MLIKKFHNTCPVKTRLRFSKGKLGFIYIYNKFYKNYLNIFSNKKKLSQPIQLEFQSSSNNALKEKGFIRRFINRPVSDAAALSVTVVSNR